MELLRKFLPAFEVARWWLVSISFQGHCELHEAGGAWDSIQFAVKELVGSGRFQGAFCLEELHVSSLFPEVAVLPHAHLVVLSDDDITESSVASLLPNGASVKVFEAERLPDFSNFLCYASKPIDFHRKYAEGWSAALARDAVWQLNQNKAELIDGWQMECEGRRQHSYYGTLHHSSREFCGVERSKRCTRKHRTIIAAMLEELSLEPYELDSENL